MIKEALTEFAKASERVFSNRAHTVGASEIGQCARKVGWAKTGGQRDVRFVQAWGAHLRGNIMEAAFWEPAMRMKYGENFLYAGAQQKTLEDSYLSATPDGLVCGLQTDALRGIGVDDIESDCILVECKTVDPRVSMVKERDANHFQVQVQLGLVRAKTSHKPEWAVISYIDASFWDECAEFPVKYDEEIYRAAQRRAHDILTLDPKQLKPEGWIAGGQECEHCPFVDPCGVVRRSVPERERAADPQFVAEIADMCRDALSAQQEADAATAEVRDVQQQIKDRMREKDVRRIPGVVVWSMSKGRVSYDMPALKEAATAAGVDVERYSTVGEPTDRLQILLGRSRGR